MPTTKVELNAEQRAWLDRVRAKAAKDRHLEGPPFTGTTGEPVRNFLALRTAVGRFKSARERIGLTISEVAATSGIPEQTLADLESGTFNNPTWKMLGDYASAVGIALTISIDPVGDS